VEKEFGKHNYNLTMAVCPTKNMDRYEWFVEKATEIGVNAIVPIIGDYSQRKNIKTERLQKILISAAKQSLKGRVPNLLDFVSVKDFLNSSFEENSIKLIAYCGDKEKISISEALKNVTRLTPIVVLIGPEGDFSEEEIKLALSKGFKLLSLGESRLRTETAAVATVAGVYFIMN
jgi:RNA methyltransferase, RsmE family